MTALCQQIPAKQKKWVSLPTSLLLIKKTNQLFFSFGFTLITAFVVLQYFSLYIKNNLFGNIF